MEKLKWQIFFLHDDYYEAEGVVTKYRGCLIMSLLYLSLFKQTGDHADQCLFWMAMELTLLSIVFHPCRQKGPFNMENLIENIFNFFPVLLLMFS